MTREQVMEVVRKSFAGWSVEESAKGFVRCERAGVVRCIDVNEAAKRHRFPHQFIDYMAAEFRPRPWEAA